eukprot:m.622693 g.622693  ORF g.622693 m.622693 type:complete len:186 (+) comp58221_c0_seq1:912-1469(+)
MRLPQFHSFSLRNSTGALSGASPMRLVAQSNKGPNVSLPFSTPHTPHTPVSVRHQLDGDLCASAALCQLLCRDRIKLRATSAKPLQPVSANANAKSHREQQRSSHRPCHSPAPQGSAAFTGLPDALCTVFAPHGPLATRQQGAPGLPFHARLSTAERENVPSSDIRASLRPSSKQIGGRRVRRSL